MASLNAMLTTLMLVLFHAASVRAVSMDAGDQLALIAVRSAVNYPQNFPSIECGDRYFVCDGSGRVTRMSINVKQLGGTLAPEIGNLRMLTFLELFLNQLSGSIPSSIGQLTSLTYLHLGMNSFSGEIPSSIGQLTSLTGLFLHRNKLSGSIPSSFGQLTSLENLILSENRLSGIIPSSIGQLVSLVSFAVNQNYFFAILKVNGHPVCEELATNCLFDSNLPSNCNSSLQRTTFECAPFRTSMDTGDKLALEAVRSAIAYPGNFPSIKCEDTYIFCDVSGRVTRLDFRYLELGGTISSEIGNLKKLTYL